MAWNSKVMDNLEQLYWSLGKLGVTPARRSAASEPNRIVLEGEFPENANFYTRLGSFATWKAKVHEDEEILNQVIEIALGIAPTSFISDALFRPLGIEPTGRIEVIGREVSERHRQLAPQQYTQHDGFYVAKNSIVAMEMKLGAKTSVEQLLKYCTQIALEEIMFGSKEHVGLIYVVPKSRVQRTLDDLKIGDPVVKQALRDKPSDYTDKSRLLRLLENHPVEIAQVIERLQLAVIGWDDLLDTIRRTRQKAETDNDETLRNLMSGLKAQIEATPSCDLK